MANTMLSFVICCMSLHHDPNAPTVLPRTARLLMLPNAPANVSGHRLQNHVLLLNRIRTMLATKYASLGSTYQGNPPQLET